MASRNVAQKLILASASPRRQAFFRDLSLEFEVRVAEIDESPLPGEEPAALASRLARTKAAAVAQTLYRDATNYMVVAADTVVAMDGEILGKPVDPADATAMLQRLRDRKHAVITSVSICETSTGSQRTLTNVTDVRMRNYSDAEIASYVRSGDPMDKAGAYAIQHPEFAPVASIEGCLSGVMGLPLGDLRLLLHEFGLEGMGCVAPLCEVHSQFRCCQRDELRSLRIPPSS